MIVTGVGDFAVTSNDYHGGFAAVSIPFFRD